MTVKVNNINDKIWTKFSIVELFNINNTHSILKSKIVENSGTHPYVTAKDGNNSVESYISYNMDEIEEGNSILIGGKTLVITYQPEDYFSNDSHNLALYLKNSEKRTKHIQLFLISALKASLFSFYTWGDSISKRSIAKDFVYLPSLDGKEPDWEFMDTFMSGVEASSLQALTDLVGITKTQEKHLDLIGWEEFHIQDIFEIDSGSKFDKSKMDTSIEVVNFVGRSNFNNGVTAKVNIVEGIKPYNKGYLTLALGGAYLGSCFVQTDPFYTSQNVVVLIPKENMTWAAKQFICTAIFIESQNNYRAFEKELNAHIKRDFTFKLPVKSKGVPDYEYMSKYIQKTKNKVSKSFDKLMSTL